MQFEDVLYSRKSVRKYKKQEIPKEDLLKILDAARVAPSGKNCQNWYFLVVRNSKVLYAVCTAIYDENQRIVKKMKEIDEKKAAKFEKFCRNFTLFIEKAPVVILVFAKNYYPSGYEENKLCKATEKELEKLMTKTNPGMQSIGAAVEHMALESVNLGYGGCWLTSANYAADKIESVLKEEILFEKEGYFFTGMLTVGVPADGEHKCPPRKPLEEISMFID